MLIKKQWKKIDVQICESFIDKIDRSLVDNRKFLSLLKYDNMFNELFEYMNNNKNLYGHYSW